MMACAFGLWGFWIAAAPFNDNSFFTHLATGRLILDGNFPTSDVYSFTAAGEPWVVQSWLVSVLFAGAERIAGGVGIHILLMVLSAVLAVLVYALSKPAKTLIPRVAITAIAVGIGALMWSERPLLIGFLGLALTYLVAERRLNPFWLIPVFWIWANSHGTFPLGLGLLVALALGRKLDGGDPGPELKALLWAGAGTVVAVIGPLGFNVLRFPFTFIERQETFSNILEWQSPQFDGTAARLFLIQIVVAVLLLIRRPSFRVGIPMLLFVASALLALRGIPVAAIVLVPGMAVGAEGLGTLTGKERSVVATALTVILGAAAVLVLLSVVNLDEQYRFTIYPEGPMAFLAAHDADPTKARVITLDYAGNWIEGVWGTDAKVFIDDRYDMYPTEVPDAYHDLLAPTDGWEETLAKYEAEVVVWNREEPLSRVLSESPGWQIVYEDNIWIVACDRESGNCTQFN